MNLINTVDSLMRPIDIVEAIIGFCRREDVRRYTMRGFEILKTLLFCFFCLAVAAFWLAIAGVKIIYREWKSAWPLAVAAFQEGYCPYPDLQSAKSRVLLSRKQLKLLSVLGWMSEAIAWIRIGLLFWLDGGYD
jgi:hypothetical protein